MKFLIMGLANSGKTRLYNALSGSHELTANYPMTTLELQSAPIRGTDHYVWDTPGINSLINPSEEELPARELLMTPGPREILFCIDPKRLFRSLILAEELRLTGLPLRMIWIADESETPVQEEELNALRSRLSAPLPRVIPENRTGVKSLIQSLDTPAESAGGPPGKIPAADGTPEEIRRILTDLGDGCDPKAERRYAQTRPRLRAAVETLVPDPPKIRESSKSARLAALCRHRVYGLPILTLAMAISYLAVVHLASWLTDLMNTLITDPVIGLLAPVLPRGFWTDLLIGDYGILTLGLFNALTTVLPILSVFFFLFGIMEDSGYMPNLTVLVRRLFEKLGLSGKSVMPVILGFGCKTMATLTARSIPSKKERHIAIYLIAFAIPCSAQMGLNMAILGKAGPGTFVLAFGFLLAVEIGAGIILNKLLPEDGPSWFIQELPPLRRPRLRPLLNKTGHRLVHFLKESIPVFIIAAVLLFAAEETGLLGALKDLLAPVVIGWLGLPLDMVDALILTMARHEAAAGLILRMVNQGMLDPGQILIAVVITTMFVPCFANIVAMFKETGAKIGIAMTLAINISSFILAGGLRWALVLGEKLL